MLLEVVEDILLSDRLLFRVLDKTAECTMLDKGDKVEEEEEEEEEEVVDKGGEEVGEGRVEGIQEDGEGVR